MKTLFEREWLGGSLDEKNLDHSSFDLTLSDEGYFLPKGSIKPSGKSYRGLIERGGKYFEKISPKEGEFELLPSSTYVFRVDQRLESALRTAKNIHGQATAKSSIGRVDVLVRLIVDGMDSYDSFTPEAVAASNGLMWVEITPLTFKVAVKEGIPITQLRLFYGRPEDCELRGKELHATSLIGDETNGFLRVDLTPDEKLGTDKGCAFIAKDDPGLTAIRLWKEQNLPKPRDYWDLLPPEEFKNNPALTIRKNRFYILRSIEKIALPKGVAVYCIAIDETIGEMRIHYAGFVHPLFGRERRDGKKGTPLIFEVRGHDVQAVLTNKEKLAKLRFYRMSEDCDVKPLEKQEQKEGDSAVKAPKSPYDDQTLQLSSLFAPWETSSIN